MEFLIIAHDGRDEQALERRMTARPAHLEMIATLRAQGKVLYAAALLDDNERMIGSCMVLNFPSRAEVDTWLSEEPYVTGKVWQDISITPCRTAPAK